MSHVLWGGLSSPRTRFQRVLSRLKAGSRPGLAAPRILPVFEACYRVDLPVFVWERIWTWACHSHQLPQRLEAAFLRDPDCVAVAGKQVPVDRLVRMPRLEPLDQRACFCR